MRTRVQAPLADYELRHWSEREPGQDIERFHDHFAAARLVRLLLHAGHGLYLRTLVERSGSAHGLDFVDGDELVGQLAGALVRGSIIAIRHPAKIMVSHPPLVLDAPAPLVPNEIADLGSVMMRPSAAAPSLVLSVKATPEVLGLATSHQAP